MLTACTANTLTLPLPASRTFSINYLRGVFVTYGNAQGLRQILHSGILLEVLGYHMRYWGSNPGACIQSNFPKCCTIIPAPQENFILSLYLLEKGLYVHGPCTFSVPVKLYYFYLYILFINSVHAYFKSRKNTENSKQYKSKLYHSVFMENLVLRLKPFKNSVIRARVIA